MSLDSVPNGSVASRGATNRWWALAVLTAAQACHHIDRNVVSVVAEPIRAEFHLSDSQVGLMGTLAYAIAFAVAALPMGYLVDRISRRNLLAAILAIWSGMTALGGAANSFIHLVVARMGVGAAEAGGSPTAVSMVSDFFGPKNRSTALGVWYLSSGIGTGIIFLVGGFLAKAFGWRTVFLVAAIPGFLVALTLLLTVREPRRGAAESREVEASPAPGDELPATPAESLLFVLRRPSILCAMASIIMGAAMSSAFGLWAVSFLVRIHHIDLPVAAMWIALAFAGFGTVIPLAAGIFGDRFAASKTGPRPGRLPLLSACTMSGVVIFGSLAALSPSPAVAIGAMLLWCGFMLAHNGPANAFIVTLLRPRMRGQVVAGLQMIASLVGAGLGPFLVGMLSDFYGGPNSLRWAILTGMSLNALAVVFFLISAWRARRDIALDA
jgi:MFS family permease